MSNKAYPQQGDWARFPNGGIGYTGNRMPRIIDAPLPDGLRDSWSYRVSNGSVYLEGKTSIKIQVGWIYTGRLRYNAVPPLNNPLMSGTWESAENRNLFPLVEVKSTDKMPSGADEINFTLIGNGRICNLQGGSASGKNFWTVTASGLGINKTESKSWFAISNGDGTIRWEKA